MCERLSKAHPPQPASPHSLGSGQQQLLAELKGGPHVHGGVADAARSTANERSVVHGVVRSLGRIKVSERKGSRSRAC